MVKNKGQPYEGQKAGYDYKNPPEGSPVKWEGVCDERGHNGSDEWRNKVEFSKATLAPTPSRYLDTQRT